MDERYLGPVKAAQLETDLGPIYLTPTGKSTVRVHAPHLTADGMPLQASAFLVSSDHGFIFSPQWDSKAGTLSTAPNALQARLVDGRMADPIILGKLAQVLAPTVSKFAAQNEALFLEAERRNIHNDLAGLEGQLEDCRSKLEKKERELAAVDDALNRLR